MCSCTCLVLIWYRNWARCVAYKCKYFTDYYYFYYYYYYYYYYCHYYRNLLLCLLFYFCKFLLFE